MNFQRGSERDEPEINLIPLIDVTLVILIFLMLTTTFSKVSGLEVNLPTADTEQSASVPNEIQVAITQAGEVLINGEPASGREVEVIASDLGRARPLGDREPVVVIHADAATAHQRVIDVMQAAQRAGLAHITFSVQSSGE